MQTIVASLGTAQQAPSSSPRTPRSTSKAIQAVMLCASTAHVVRARMAGEEAAQTSIDLLYQGIHAEPQRRAGASTVSSPRLMQQQQPAQPSASDDAHEAHEWGAAHAAALLPLLGLTPSSVLVEVGAR
jgi:hypothetical protein